MPMAEGMAQKLVVDSRRAEKGNGALGDGPGPLIGLLHAFPPLFLPHLEKRPNSSENLINQAVPVPRARPVSPRF